MMKQHKQISLLQPKLQSKPSTKQNGHNSGPVATAITPEAMKKDEAKNPPSTPPRRSTRERKLSSKLREAMAIMERNTSNLMTEAESKMEAVPREQVGLRTTSSGNYRNNASEQDNERLGDQVIVETRPQCGEEADHSSMAINNTNLQMPPLQHSTSSSTSSRQLLGNHGPNTNSEKSKQPSLDFLTKGNIDNSDAATNDEVATGQSQQQVPNNNNNKRCRDRKYEQSSRFTKEPVLLTPEERRKELRRIRKRINKNYATEEEKQRYLTLTGKTSLSDLKVETQQERSHRMSMHRMYYQKSKEKHAVTIKNRREQEEEEREEVMDPLKQTETSLQMDGQVDGPRRISPIQPAGDANTNPHISSEKLPSGKTQESTQRAVGTLNVERSHKSPNNETTTSSSRNASAAAAAMSRTHHTGTVNRDGDTKRTDGSSRTTTKLPVIIIIPSESLALLEQEEQDGDDEDQPLVSEPNNNTALASGGPTKRNMMPEKKRLHDRRQREINNLIHRIRNATATEQDNRRYKELTGKAEPTPEEMENERKKRQRHNELSRLWHRIRNQTATQQDKLRYTELTGKKEPTINSYKTCSKNRKRNQSLLEQAVAASKSSASNFPASTSIDKVATVGNNNNGARTHQTVEPPQKKAKASPALEQEDRSFQGWRVAEMKKIERKVHFKTATTFELNLYQKLLRHPSGAVQPSKTPGDTAQPQAASVARGRNTDSKCCPSIQAERSNDSTSDIVAESIIHADTGNVVRPDKHGSDISPCDLDDNIEEGTLNVEVIRSNVEVAEGMPLRDQTPDAFPPIQQQEEGQQANMIGTQTESAAEFGDGSRNCSILESKIDHQPNQLMQENGTHDITKTNGIVQSSRIQGPEQIDYVNRSPSRKSEDESEVSAIWQTMFEQLQDFHAANGHCMVPSKWKPNLSLSTWCALQREALAAGELPKVHERKLKRIGFVLEKVEV